MDVFFMRHGETDWNVQKRLQGRTDKPLNQNGIALAQKEAENSAKSGISFDFIFSSPLFRASKTAEIFSKQFSAPLFLDDRLLEFSFGNAEGHTFDEVKKSNEFLHIKNWFEQPEKYKASKGSESFEDFFNRTSSFLSDMSLLEQSGKVRSVLIVCHGGVVRAFISIMKNLPISDFARAKIPNCALNKATVQNGIFRVEYTARLF